MTNITIYTKDYCPYCIKAKNLLENKKLSFKEINLTEDEQGRIELVQKANGLKTVPQIFIGDYHVGGCDKLVELEQNKQLDDLIEKYGK